MAEEAVPQAEKAAKVINEQADKVAENIEPMADKASKTLVDNAKQISDEGPQAADKAQAQVDDLAGQIAKQAQPQADKVAQIITGAAQGIKENAEPTAKVCLPLLAALRDANGLWTLGHIDLGQGGGGVSQCNCADSTAVLHFLAPCLSCCCDYSCCDLQSVYKFFPRWVV